MLYIFFVYFCDENPYATHGCLLLLGLLQLTSASSPWDVGLNGQISTAFLAILVLLIMFLSMTRGSKKENG